MSQKRKTASTDNDATTVKWPCVPDSSGGESTVTRGNATIAVRYPLIFAQLQADKNPGVDLQSISCYSEEQLNWTCSQAGHDFRDRPANVVRREVRFCRLCAGFNLPLEETHPEIFALLHQADNEGVDLTKVNRSSTQLLRWRCEQGHMFTDEARKVVQRERLCSTCNSLKVKMPEVFAELHPTKNQGIDLENLQSRAGTQVWFVCATCQTEWRTSPAYRTLGTRCQTCSVASRSPDYNHDTVETGDKSEVWVQKLLESHSSVESVTKIGEWAGYADLIVKLRGSESQKLIQVKTFSKGACERAYTSSTQKGKSRYPDDLLIVLVSKDRKVLASDFAHTMRGGLTLTFGARPPKRHEIVSSTSADLLTRLLLLLPRSVTFVGIEETLAPSQLKEYQMFQRLVKFCKRFGLACEKNTTNGTTVDAFIGGFPVQLKHRSKMIGNSWVVGLKKSGGSVNGKHADVPYDVSDPFEFLVCELLVEGQPPDEIEGNFFVLSKAELEAQGRLKSETCLGCMCISISPLRPHDFGFGRFDKFVKLA
jgi:hypothetical protein